MAQDRNWNKIVLESGGSLLFLPKGFEQAAKDWLEMRTKYNELVKQMAEKELTLNMAVSNLFFELRKYLAKNGHEDIWLKDIGFENAALNEGKFVVSIMDAGKGRIPQM